MLEKGSFCENRNIREYNLSVGSKSKLDIEMNTLKKLRALIGIATLNKGKWFMNCRVPIIPHKEDSDNELNVKKNN